MYVRQLKHAHPRLNDAFANPLTLVCGWVILVECSDKLQEVPGTSLLKQPHQRTAESLTSIGWNLCDGSFGTTALLHITACNLLELEVSGNIGGDEDVGEFSIGHEKFGDKIDVPVIDTSVLLPWLGAFGVVAVLLEELLCVSQGKTITRVLIQAAYSFNV